MWSLCLEASRLVTVIKGSGCLRFLEAALILTKNRKACFGSTLNSMFKTVKQQVSQRVEFFKTPFQVISFQWNLIDVKSLILIELRFK